MNLTRRAAALVLASGLVPFSAVAQPRPRPIVIAHRGASGERPEHTLMAYTLAIAEGADVIEPDLVVTKDGVLVSRHEPDVAGTTNIATRADLAALKSIRTVEGRQIDQWLTDDLTLAQFQSLRARERMADVRPKSAAFDGQEAPPTFQQVIDLAKSEARRLKRPIGLYPELKDAAALRAKGFDTGALLLDALAKNGLPSAENPVFIQSFEPEALRRVRGKTRARIVQTTATADMLTPEGLAKIATYADGVGPEKSMVTPAMVAEAHRLGLVVHPWTFRAENRYLPADLRKGDVPGDHGDVIAEIRRHLAMGVDGVFSDFPGLAVAARGYASSVPNCSLARRA